MARPAKFSLDDLLDAAGRVLLEKGRDITMAQIADAAGAPTGSVYHRFASREELLIRLWLRSINDSKSASSVPGSGRRRGAP